MWIQFGAQELEQMVTTLSYVSIATGLIAVLTLFFASFSVPWEKQTWKGTTEWENQFKRRQRILKYVGIPCAIIAAVCQTIVTAISI